MERTAMERWSPRWSPTEYGRCKERHPSYLPLLDSEPGLPNPFVNLTAGQPRGFLATAIRCASAVTLLPVRVALSVPTLALALLLATVSTAGLADADVDHVTGQPLAAWRRLAFTPALGLLRFQLLLLGFWRIKTKGRCASRQEAPIIVANHVSGMIEGLVLMRHAKVVEKEYAANPLVGPFLRATSAILVDRADPTSRERTKRAVQQRAAGGDWPQTLVFPEGTCTNGTAVVQFKLGAFAPGCPVQPVAFRYPGNINDHSFTFPLNNAAYILNMLLSPWNIVEVEFLPVYRPSDAEVRNPASFAASVQRCIARALGVPTTKHAAEDVALSVAARMLDLPMESGVVQWQAISESLIGVSVRDAKAVLLQFRAMDSEAKGRVGFEAFALAMNHAAVVKSGDKSAAFPFSEQELRGIFELLDRDGTGYVDFQEYLCGVAVLNGHGRREQVDAIKWTFDSLAGGQNCFTKEQLQDLLVRAVPTLSDARLEELFEDADRSGDGRVTRDEFIVFAQRHMEDLGLTAGRLLCGLPLAMPAGP